MVDIMVATQVNLHREKQDLREGIVEPEYEPTLTTYTRLNPMVALIKHRLFAPSMYIISGLILLFALGVIFYTYVVRLKVETAVVSSQIETMVAPLSGYISHVYVSLGEVVKQGAPLFTIENMPLEQKLQLARVHVEEAKLRVRYDKQLLANEALRLKLYQRIGIDRVKSAETRINRLHQAVMIAQQNLSRYETLYEKKYVSHASLQMKRAELVSIQEKLKQAKTMQRVEHHSLKAVDQGMYFTGTKTEGIGRDLSAELESAKKMVQLSLDRVILYENLIKKLTIRAPFDGKITQIIKSAGNTTDTIKPIVYIEKTSANKTIIAYLSQDEIVEVGASNVVKIYIPSSGKTYHGTIIEINRTDGFIDMVKAQYRWRDSQVDRSAMVTLAIDKRDQSLFDKEAFSGLPAIVYFSKTWTL